MSKNKYLAVRARNENFDFTLVLEATPDLVAKIRKRQKLVRNLKEQDPSCWSAQFEFYGFSVYEDCDFGEAFDYDDVVFLDELPKLGEDAPYGAMARVDFGAMVVDIDGDVVFRFGIKHIPEIYETGLVSIDRLD